MKHTIVIFCIIVISAATTPAWAALIDNFGNWSAFKETEAAKRVCYIASIPKKSEGKYKRRGDITLMVTHRPAEKSFYVVSIDAGYAYKKNSEVKVSIGASKFNMFTDGRFAWAYNSKDDKKMVRAMRSGSTMIVRGVSRRGTRTTDTYSLSGFTAAQKAINKACSVR